MFTIRPILWYDPNRISQEDIAKLMAGEMYAAYIPVLDTSYMPAHGEVMPERYPTPDELFRWEPK